MACNLVLTLAHSLAHSLLDQLFPLLMPGGRGKGEGVDTPSRRKEGEGPGGQRRGKWVRRVLVSSPHNVGVHSNTYFIYGVLRIIQRTALSGLQGRRRTRSKRPDWSLPTIRDASGSCTVTRFFFLGRSSRSSGYKASNPSHLTPPPFSQPP